MKVSTSYPFLSIAKQTGIDYGTILRAAQFYRDFRYIHSRFQLNDLLTQRAIVQASQMCEAIRKGVISFPHPEPFIDV